MNYNNIVNELAKKTSNVKDEIVILNNDKPLFNKKDYELIEGEPIYFEPDEYERSTGAIAIITKNTIPLVIKKKLKYPEPYGWNKNLEGKYLFEKCHIIAYSLSAKKADKKNIFIGTDYLNTSIMKKIENKVRDYINDNDVRVLYRVTVKYKEKNKITTGILIEAKSLDDEFSICEFCYNIQKKASFKYSDGTIIEDRRILPKIKRTVDKKLKGKNKNKENEKVIDYTINKKTNEFHLSNNNCSKLKKVEPKYIQETTATKKDLENANLKPCNKCIK
jgi:DNA-entry nuclease